MIAMTAKTFENSRNMINKNEHIDQFLMNYIAFESDSYFKYTSSGSPSN